MKIEYIQYKGKECINVFVDKKHKQWIVTI